MTGIKAAKAFLITMMYRQLLILVATLPKPFANRSINPSIFTPPSSSMINQNKQTKCNRLQSQFTGFFHSVNRRKNKKLSM